MFSAPDIPAGVSDALVEAVDLYPTLASLAGLPPPPGVDGSDLQPLMHEPSAVSNGVAFSEYPRCMHNLSTPWDKLDSCVSTPREEFHLMGYSVRTPGWRYTAWMFWDARRLQGDFGWGPFAEELYRCVRVSVCVCVCVCACVCAWSNYLVPAVRAGHSRPKSH